MCSYVYGVFQTNFSLSVLNPLVLLCGFLLYLNYNGAEYQVDISQPTGGLGEGGHFYRNKPLNSCLLDKQIYVMSTSLTIMNTIAGEPCIMRK